MRKLIVPSILALAIMTFAASVYAGGSACSSSSKSAAACTGKSAAACVGKSAASCCPSGKTAALPEGMKIETARTPNGALVVFYTSDKPDVVKTLQAKAASGPIDFSCGVCREMAKSTDCKVELVPFSSGVMAFVTSEKKESIDTYEKQFAALTTTATAPAAH
jgi:hypothetical protein